MAEFKGSIMDLKQNINLQVKIYNFLPTWLRVLLYSIRLLPSYLSWRFLKLGHKNADKLLKPLENKFEGCRCVVIGNGPSLKKMDLHSLENEYTFGLNRIYLLFDELGFKTTFLVAVNRLVIKQFAKEIDQVSILKVLNWKFRSDIKDKENTAFLPPSPNYGEKRQPIADGYYPIIGSVTNVALELAFYMGFSEVVLIGMDHNFSVTGEGGKAVTSQGADADHFSPNYFGKGILWQLPNYALMEHGYTVAKKLFEKDNRKIVDATVNGKLEVFPKVIFEDFLANSTYKNRKANDALTSN